MEKPTLDAAMGCQNWGGIHTPPIYSDTLQYVQTSPPISIGLNIAL